MTLKEQKYDKALDAMLTMSVHLLYEFMSDSDNIEDFVNSDLNLKGYFLTLKEWINDNNSKLESLPTELTEKIKEIVKNKNTRLKDISKDIEVKPTRFY